MVCSDDLKLGTWRSRVLLHFDITHIRIIGQCFQRARASALTRSCFVMPPAAQLSLFSVSEPRTFDSECISKLHISNRICQSSVAGVMKRQILIEFLFTPELLACNNHLLDDSSVYSIISQFLLQQQVCSAGSVCSSGPALEIMNVATQEGAATDTRPICR